MTEIITPSTEIVVPKREFVDPGIYPNISNADYHGSEGISKTRLDLFNDDQSSLEWAKNCPVDKEKLKTLDFGDAMHAICLEPERLRADFAVLPPLNLRTNIDKERKREFEKENAHKKIISADDYTKLSLMFESVMAHPYARSLLEDPGISEQSYYWTDPDSGVLCKCRPDRKLHNLPILVDVKTTDLLSKFKFSIDDYRYYVQDPFYSDGVEACGDGERKFVFIAIQKTIELGRYPVRCEHLPAWAIKFGRDEYKRNLYDYAIATDSGQFNGIYTSTLARGLMRKAAVID